MNAKKRPLDNISAAPASSLDSILNRSNKKFKGAKQNNEGDTLKEKKSLKSTVNDVERKGDVKKEEGNKDEKMKGKISIDELFKKGIEKRNMNRVEGEQELKEKMLEKERIAKALSEREESLKGNDEAKIHRFDATSGLPIYKYYDLKIKQDDGGTNNCPFDCWCCF